MNGQRILSIIMLVGFVVFCFLPITAKGLSLGVQTADMVRVAENRVISSRPDFSALGKKYSAYKKLPEEFEKYWSDTFPYRLEIIDVFNSCRTPGVESFNRSGIFGRDGWMYYNEASTRSQTIDDFLGKMNLTQKEFEASFSKLDQKRRKYEERGIRFYFLIAPNKVTVHPEYLLNPMPDAKGETIRERYMAFYRERLKKGDIPDFIIDLSDVLIREKDLSGKIFYFPLDTHWNWEGRLLAMKTLCDRIRRDFPILPVMPSLTMRPEPGYAGLPHMMGKKMNREEVELAQFPLPTHWDAIETQNGEASSISDNAKWVRYFNEENELDLFYVGDSFVESYLPLPEALVFRNSHMIYAPVFGSSVAQLNIFNKAMELRPDVIVEESVERYLKDYVGM